MVVNPEGKIGADQPGFLHGGRFLRNTSFGCLAAAGSIWGIRTVRRTYGNINVYYEYEGGELIRRIYDSPAGKIIDSVTTDDVGRIIAFRREPDNWQSFWPIKEATKRRE
jgi:hypothetical protein